LNNLESTHHFLIANTWIIWIVLAPLVGALINTGLFFSQNTLTQSQKQKISAIIACTAAGMAFLISFFLFWHMHSQTIFVQTLFTWINSSVFKVRFALNVDSLSSIMIVFITFVAFCIHVYSSGYMDHDEGFIRYFIFLNLFLSSMALLILSSNLLLMFIGWEGVGICSYLLISFWYQDPKNVQAGEKAILLNRIGDVGFLLGLIVVFSTIHSFNFIDLEAHRHLFSPGLLTFVDLCFFWGATAKSAQIPLYVWLPDAMAGPTPVSALIHAATMVTAGVYLLVRLNILYFLSPEASCVIAITGVLTAFFAATVATVQNDMKKILAYSTISQLGYMMLAVGVGDYASGIFHLISHGFFKACLFLSAGAVMHLLMQEQDIRKMGGLLKTFPLTALVFLVSGLALAGFPPFSGFFSKDAILWGAFSHPNPLIPWLPTALYTMGLITAFLTAFYISRMIILIFWGEYRGNALNHTHSLPWVMSVPMVILAIGSLIVGWIGIPKAIGGKDWINHFLHSTFFLIPRFTTNQDHLQVVLMLISTLVSASGIILAWIRYVRYPKTRLENQPQGFLKLLDHKYYIDEFYQKTIGRCTSWVAGWISEWGIENQILGRLVDNIALFFEKLSKGYQKIQSGLVRNYLFYMILGAAVFFIVFVCNH
jgi:NADH-quinone oxidoreductase subunit L